jgi:hypothetical protein
MVDDPLELAFIARQGATILGEAFNEGLADELNTLLMDKGLSLGEVVATLLCFAANGAAIKLHESGESAELVKTTPLVYAAYIMQCFSGAYAECERQKGLH